MWLSYSSFDVIAGSGGGFWGILTLDPAPADVDRQISVRQPEMRMQPPEPEQADREPITAPAAPVRMHQNSMR